MMPIKIVEANTDFEVQSLDTSYGNITTQKKETVWSYLRYMIIGAVFGIILVKSEVISWYRIQEMFRLQSFHMYGVIGSAIITGMISVFFIKKFNIKTLAGEEIVLPKKTFHKGQIYGGLIFGFGWAITGACPGPLFAQIGLGFSVIIVTLISAIAGTWLYGFFKEQLPH